MLLYTDQTSQITLEHVSKHTLKHALKHALKLYQDQSF